MEDEGPVSRRGYLALIGASGLGGLAGCGGQTEPTQGTTSSTPAETVTATPTDTTTDTIEETETPDQWDVDPVEQDKLVGAHYYPWYWGEDGYGKNEDRPWLDHSPYTPELGQYDSRDTDVVNQHIKWAVENGVNWFLLNSGPSRGKKGRSIENSYLEAELSDQIHWSVGTGLDHLPVKDEEGRWVIDDPENIDALKWFLEDFEQAWFDHPNYLHIDGRPAVFDFTAGSRYAGDIEAGFDAAMDDLETRPYMIANPPAIWYPEFDTPEGVFAAYDAVKTYIDLPWRDEIDEQDYVNHWDTMAERWRLLTDRYDVSYIPGVTPGYDDTERKGTITHDVLDLTPDEFGELCDNALKYVEDSGPNAVIVTSWNEFPEGTTLEPAEEYGHTRLQTVKEHLGQANTSPIDVNAYPLIELEFNRTVTTGSGDDRSLAFYFSEFGLHDDVGEIRSYDIGNYPEEPAFISGTYHPTENQGVSGRWIGGEEARSSLYIHPDTAKATEAVLSGWPPGTRDIAADVYVDGERTDQVRFDPGGHAVYSVSLVD